MKNKVTINGRFLTMPLSGVQRTAYELVMALDELLEKGVLNPADNDFTIVYSGTIINNIDLKHIKLSHRGVFKGNLWEQLELPFYSWGTMLLSMCSISALFKIRQTVIVHDASFFVNKAFFSRAFRLWYKFAIPVLGKVARQIITVSEFSKAELHRYAGINPDKTTVIYNSAEHILRFGPPSTAFKAKIEALKPYCLAVSNLAANKNFTRLSEAIERINFNKYNMLIAGGSMNTLKSVSPAGRAVYLGYVSDEELKYLYGNASLFIFPSIYEGFGIPPLEAMILGCPVIASNTSSLPEVLQDACWYFDPLDVANMAAKIDELLNNELALQNLRLKGYQQVAKYAWIRSALQLNKIISKNNV